MRFHILDDRCEIKRLAALPGFILRVNTPLGQCEHLQEQPAAVIGITYMAQPEFADDLICQCKKRPGSRNPIAGERIKVICLRFPLLFRKYHSS